MENVTALGAGDFSEAKTQNIIFISEDHKQFYSMMLEQVIYREYNHEVFYVKDQTSGNKTRYSLVF